MPIINRKTEHHMFFPACLWKCSNKAMWLRSNFTVNIPESIHRQLNEWVEQNIGFIPPIPPRELDKVYARVCDHDGPLKSRLTYLIEVIRDIADHTPNATVKTSMTLTWRNLQLEGEQLNILPKIYLS